MRALRAVVVAFVVVFLLAPLVVIAVGSVNQNRYLNFPPEGFSLSWYAQLFTDSGWRTSIRYRKLRSMPEPGEQTSWPGWEKPAPYIE